MTLEGEKFGKTLLVDKESLSGEGNSASRFVSRDLSLFPKLVKAKTSLKLFNRDRSLCFKIYSSEDSKVNRGYQYMAL